MAYFVYSYLLVGFIFTYHMATCARTSGYLFFTHTSSWWPVLYIREFLKALSAHEVPHVWPIFYKYHLYGTLVFYSLFCLFSSPLWANLHSKILWLNARITGDLFCTHILLVTYSVSHTLLTAHSVHIPLVTYCFYTSEFTSLWRIFSWHILCMSYFVYWLLLRELYLRDISWVHVHVPLMTYSVLLHSLEFLLYIRSFRRRILYTYLSTST